MLRIIFFTTQPGITRHDGAFIGLFIGDVYAVIVGVWIYEDFNHGSSRQWKDI